MEIATLSGALTKTRFPSIGRYCEARPNPAMFKGLAGSGDAFLAADLYRQSKSTLLVLTENTKSAERLADDCLAILGSDNDIALFPSRDAVPYNMKSPFGPTVEARLGILSDLLAGRRRLIIAPAAALLQRTPERRELFSSIIRLETGAEVPMDSLANWLSGSGFRRENRTDDLGAFSIRGGILDLYPFLSDNPYRIEFWGDTIESIRSFDVFTQKSVGAHKSLEIVPMREFCFSDANIDSAVERMLASCKSGALPADEAAIRKLEHQWKTVGDLDGAEWFWHWFGLGSASILDYLPTDAIVVWDDIVPMTRRLGEAVDNYTHHLERVPEAFAPLVSPPAELLFDEKTITEELSCYNVIFIDTVDTPKDTTTFTTSLSPQPSLQQEMSLIVNDLRERAGGGYRCLIACHSAGHAERMAELLGDDAGSITEVVTGALNGGFICNDAKLLVYSESQIFNRPYRAVKVKKQKSGTPLGSFDQLSVQDIVVHVEHGIGRFVGVERVTAGDSVTDCMVLVYADNAKVYVPIEDFHKVQKYVGKEGFAPPLSKIGTQTWERLKERTRESLREMAQELIALYAKRQFLEGISFAPDNVWQREFEDSFIYEETPDQLRAIKEVKADMESAKPMDRLICGDVGFGKTEVAMRAAFKAVMSGHQAAVLAPTTILAAQHFATFSERMSSFPVRIEVLSRFQKGKEVKATLEKLADGKVDILIGTHRILSDDIKFKNLGLLIIDEEQRFGVKHKEALKQLRYKADALSMTATPIPRTLHMSLVGARDLSIINTPPRNRLPIETVVAEYHDDLVKSAIETELDRGGQIYFVNNRISNIPALQDRLEILAPKAKTISAHGQMDESELEAIMKEFIAGRYDILLSTVIIENGLDIPNVNTIIVNRADTLGLSQLYQLRGRVGRSSEQAYAYFLTPPFNEVKEDSLKRLRALEQYTDLGSGFQIAMRDLEIRGAGNILGTRQHGFIAAVGFELYCQLLQDAVDEIKGGAESEENNNAAMPDTRLDVPMQAYIPTEYIADGQTRIAVYQEMSSLKTTEELSETERGLSDRFGALPEPVEALILLMRLKILGRQAGCSKISIGKDGALILSIDGDQDTAKERIRKIFETAPRYEFEVAYETEKREQGPTQGQEQEPAESARMQVQLRTELTADTVPGMTIEAAQLLEG
ncbi:MAG: transcription-repair coupling factor [Chitinispirillales bacterium]|jgi:transcription-repair coupling factor (superfamily II helicase)|nr:transcription-repair coupling factor [Chitinispirillales bacterium]